MTETDDLHARLVAAEAKAISYELALSDILTLLRRGRSLSAESRACNVLRTFHSGEFKDTRKDVPNAHHG